MSRTYARDKCNICGKYISVNGLAQTSHLRKHVREGILIETRDGEGYPIFKRARKAEDNRSLPSSTEGDNENG
jgi:hypothetical protein